MYAAPYLAIFFAFLLIYAPRLVVAYGQAKRPEGYDNRHPREQQAKLEGRALRAQGAHMNGFEAFAPFAAAVLACEIARVDVTKTALLAAAFVGVRIVYVVLYLADRATLRTLVWLLGFGIVCALFLQPVLLQSGSP